MTASESNLTKLTTGGLVFNYACPRQTNSCVRRVIEMVEPIDRKAMENALELTRKRYPQLSLALVKTRSGVYEQFHDVPFKLNDLSSGLHYIMGEDTDGHLIAFFMRDNLLLVDYFHAIADDAGMDKFIQTLLYHYLALQGHELDNSDGSILTIATEFTPEEGEDSGSELLDPDHEPDPQGSGWAPPARAFRISAQHRSVDEPDYSYTISVPFDEFKALAKRNAASPTAVVSSVFGRVLYRRYFKGLRKDVLYPNSPVTAEVAVNLRNHFPSQTVRCFTGNIYLSYNESSDRMDIEDLIARQAQGIKRTNTREGMVDCYNHSMTLAKKTFSVEVAPCVKNWIHKHIATKAMSKGMTYGISNIGKAQIPDCLKPYVKDYYSQIPSALHAYLISMRTKGDRMTLCITTKIEDSPSVVDEFISELGELGVNATLERAGDFYFTRYVQNRTVISKPASLAERVSGSAKADRSSPKGSDGIRGRMAVD